MDFVSFEIAKKLKEKGYGESWDYVYNDDGVICIPCYNLTEEDTIPMCPAPQIHEVLKWLREVKGMDVLPQRGHINLDNKGKVTRYYNVDIYLERRFACTLDNDEQDYSTYEQAAIAGIEYVIDNLFEYENKTCVLELQV